MIQLLFVVLFIEGAVSILLLVKIGPLRELVMRGLDQLKTGKGPATAKTLACTMTLIFFSSLTSIFKIQNRGTKLGTVTPMDQVLWRTHLVEALLIGYTLFLGFVIYRLHHYLRKMEHLKTSVGAAEREIEKLRKGYEIDKDKEDKFAKEVKSLREEVSSLTDELQKLKLESEEKEKRAATAEAHCIALQKQSADLLLEYDHLLEENQLLQSQLLSIKG